MIAVGTDIVPTAVDVFELLCIIQSVIKITIGGVSTWKKRKHFYHGSKNTKRN